MALKTLKERKKKLYNTTFWSSGANCNEIQQSLNGGSKQSKRLVFVRKIHTLKGPYCCTQGAGNLSEFLRGIWWGLNGHLDKSSRVPGGGPRGKPLIDALLLQKTGNWPVHDIKSFAIPTFLSSLLLKEQMMISKKKNLCERIWDRKARGGFEQKIDGFKRQHLQVVAVSVVVIVAQANTHHFPPPPKLAKFPSCFIKNVREISTMCGSRKYPYPPPPPPHGRSLEIPRGRGGSKAVISKG